MNAILHFLSWRETPGLIDREDILARQRYLLFRAVSLLGAFFMLLMAIEDLIITGYMTNIALSMVAVSAALVINYLALPHHRNFTLAYVGSVVSFIALIHAVTYSYGGIRNPDFLFIGSIILYAYVILENKGGKITLYLSLFNVIYFYALSDFTEPGAFITNDLTGRAIDLKHLVTAIISMVVMTSLSSYLSFTKNAVIRRIEESKDILEKKNEELSELSLVASETINSVVITSEKGNIEWVNEGFVRLTGFTPQEANGKRMSEFLYGELTDRNAFAAMENASKQLNTFSTEIIKYRKDGAPIWVQEDVTRIRDAKGNTEKYIFIESDISERKKSEEQMQEYLSNLERTNRELDKFAYVVSHDLKAPLRAIGNLTGWIEEDTGHLLPGEVRSHFNLIKERVLRMEALINGILDYSKVAKSNNQFEQFNVADLVNSVTQMLGNPSDCEFIIDQNLPRITADKVKMEQIFMNLISNAIKFNKQPEKKVKVSVTDFGTHYRFSIIDNGPGIDPRFHEKIFQIFQTIHTKDEFESNGLGLAIVKKLVEEQQCDIWVESESGKGATFHFTWPKVPVVSERMNLYTPEKV